MEIESLTHKTTVLSFDNEGFVSHMLPILRGEGLVNEATRLCECGQKFNIFHCESEKYHEEILFAFPFRCELRICPNCCKKRASKLHREILEIIKKIDKTKTHKFAMLTVTLNMSKGRLLSSDRLRDFNKKVRKLINTLYPKVDGCGALAVLEIGKRFNIHAHILVYGPYVSQREISARWLKITGDSYIVDIRALHNQKQATSYLLKYIAKPPEFGKLEHYAIFLKALKGVRRLHRYGILYGFRVGKKKSLLCPYCGGRLEYDSKDDSWVALNLCEDYWEVCNFLNEKLA